MNQNIVQLAGALAEKYHANQKYGDAPYIKHIMDAYRILNKFGFGHNDILVAAIFLHDVLEDTKATTVDLAQEGIPGEVLKVVVDVTDAPWVVGREAKKLDSLPRIAKSRRATIVKLCDRIANVEAGGKIDMYKKEYPTFRKFLYNPDFDLQDMWDYLDDLMDYKD